MQWKECVGVGYATQQGETAFLAGFNGVGDERPVGSPVCWDAVASDGVTFALPEAGALFQNFSMLAGILNETVGTAEYTHQIVAYGRVSARAWGVASTYLPGALLILTDGDDYVSYGSAGQINGVITINQPIAITALETNASAATTSSLVFVKALG